MTIDGFIPSPGNPAERRSNSWSGESAEQVRFLTESPRYSTKRQGNRSRRLSISSLPDEDWNGKIVLSCGGGGFRALCQLFVMKDLFERVAYYERTLDPNNKATSSADSPYFRFNSDEDKGSHPNFRVPIASGTYLPCHYFDYIGGTSVGGIIAVMFGRLRLSVDQGIRSFESIWKTMGATMSRYDRVVPFRRAKTSNSLGLERAFKDLLDERKDRLDRSFRMNSFEVVTDRDAVSDEFASDPELCRTIVIAMPDGLDDGLQRPVLFRSYDDPRERRASQLYRISSGTSFQTNGTTVLISDICRATSAAPGFFKGVNIGDKKFRDGAIWTNNPALELYCSIEAADPDVREPIQLLVNLGSGRRRSRKFSSPTRLSSRRHESDESIDRFLARKLDTGYCTFEGPSDLFDLEINEWKSDGSGHKTFQRIQKSTERYCSQKPVKERLDHLAKRLVQLRQRRARTTRWERFALGVQYACRESPYCDSHSERFDDRESFTDHLMWEHNEPPQDEANWNRIQKLLAESQTTTVK